jgi:Lon protease-like protein
MSDEHSSLAGFGGSVRLFPLPNLVLFPHVMQPLHIFEPRYRQMTAEALQDDRFIAMVLLKPGWEAEYAGQPAIHDIACLGKNRRRPETR